MMVAQLKYYRKMNDGALPTVIMYYRDGVSDGQFNEVSVPSSGYILFT